MVASYTIALASFVDSPHRIGTGWRVVYLPHTRTAERHAEEKKNRANKLCNN